jgi:hypothetical protein
MDENRSKFQEAAALLRRTASILRRRSAVEVILGDKRVLLSHKIRGHTILRQNA